MFSISFPLQTEAVGDDFKCYEIPVQKCHEFEAEVERSVIRSSFLTRLSLHVSEWRDSSFSQHGETGIDYVEDVSRS